MRRAFRVLTATELRKEVGAARLTQKMVKSLVVMQLPSDQDPEKIEPCYVFKHDEWPGRELILKQRLGQRLEEVTLGCEQHKWQQQAERVWQAGATGMLESTGGAGLPEKESGMLFLDEFVRQWKVVSPPASDNEGDDGQEGGCASPSFWTAPGEGADSGAVEQEDEDLDLGLYDDASVAPSQGMLQRLGSRTSLATPSTAQSKKRPSDAISVQDSTEMDGEEQAATNSADDGDPVMCFMSHDTREQQKPCRP